MKPDGKGYEGRDDLGIYHHFTVAIDTDNIKRVFDDVRDMAMDLKAFSHFNLNDLVSTILGLQNFKVKAHQLKQFSNPFQF